MFNYWDILPARRVLFALLVVCFCLFFFRRPGSVLLLFPLVALVFADWPCPDKVRQRLTRALTVCLIKLEHCQRGVEMMLLRSVSVPLCLLNQAGYILMCPLPPTLCRCNYWCRSRGTPCSRPSVWPSVRISLQSARLIWRPSSRWMFTCQRVYDYMHEEALPNYRHHVLKCRHGSCAQVFLLFWGDDVTRPLKASPFWFPIVVQVVENDLSERLLVSSEAAWKRAMNQYFLQHNTLFDCCVVPRSQESIQLWLFEWNGLFDFTCLRQLALCWIVAGPALKGWNCCFFLWKEALSPAWVAFFQLVTSRPVDRHHANPAVLEIMWLFKHKDEA